MTSKRTLIALHVAATGALWSLSCSGTCDYDAQSPPQVVLVWSVSGSGGSALSSGCAVAHAKAGVYPAVSDTPAVSSYADVIQFHAKVGDVVTVTVLDWFHRVQYRGLCGPEQPSTDLTDSTLFCGTSSTGSGHGVINGCESATGSAEPADVISITRGPDTAGFPDIISLRITGTGVFHILAHSITGDASQPCSAAPNLSVAAYPLLTILPG